MKPKNKQRKFLIIVFAIIIVAILVGVLVTLFLKKNPEEKEETSNLQQAVELVNNNYLYSYLVQGNIKVDDGFVIEDDIKYYYVNDELLSSIKTIEDINNLITNTFVDAKIASFYEKFENGHKYIEINGNLYVAKSENVCFSIVNYDQSDIKLGKIEDDKMQIELPNQTVYAYKENDKWLLGTNNNYCEDPKTNGNDTNQKKVS